MAHIPIETQTQYNDHAVGLLKTVNRSYYGSDSGFVNVVPKQVTTIWPTTPPTISQVCTVYDNNSDTDCMHPDAPNGPTFPGTGGLPMVYGSLLYQYEYGYGSGSRGGLLRKTVNDYACLDTPTYLNSNLLNLPSSVNVYDGSSTQWRETTYSYDESGSASSGCSSSSPCGELTTVSGYTNSSTHLDTHYHYNTNGMRSSMVDPKGNVTCYTYDSHGAYLSEIQHPHLATPTMCSGFAEYFSYDYDTGLLSSHTDLNGNITASSYDPMWRPTETDNPDGGFTKYCYTDLGGSFCSASSPPYDALAEDKIDASTFRTTALQVDGLGRVTRRATTNGEAEAFDEVDTCYNDLGLIGFESYPYLGPGWSSGPICSGAGDQFTYDALSRNTLITHSDSSTMSTSYSISANLYCSTVTDEQSKSRQTCADAAGRLSTVTEDPSGLNYNTTYAYDAHDNLTSVTQNSSRNRTFSYDWLSRLQQATNPESATTCYGTYSGTTCQNNGYDGDGNLVYKTDARGITTTYSYDAMNRLTQKTYSDATPTAYYLYDQTSWDGSTLTNPTGRLTSEGTWTSGSGWLTSSAYGYNKMGKVAAQYECATSSCPAWPTWRLFYNYNLISGVTSYTNGAGTTFTQTFNVGGRISSVTSSWSDSQHPASLATGIHYNAVGGLEIETLGNGLTNTVAYHVRLQPCRNNVNSTGTLLVYCTDPIPSGNVLDLTVGYNYGSGDNGNVMTWSAVGAQTFTRNFAPSGYPYDGVNRLTGMTDTATGATCTGLSWSYDAWGNRQQNIVSGSSCNHWNALYNSNNQISTVGSTTYTYDAAGNLTYDGSNNYTYDAENHLVAISGGTNAAYLTTQKDDA
jgi:YD repeat-containing protein